MKNTKTIKEVFAKVLLAALLMLAAFLNVKRLEFEGGFVATNIQIEQIDKSESVNTSNVVAFIIAIGSSIAIASYGIYTCKVKGNEIIHL